MSDIQIWIKYANFSPAVPQATLQEDLLKRSKM